MCWRLPLQLNHLEFISEIELKNGGGLTRPTGAYGGAGHGLAPGGLVPGGIGPGGVGLGGFRGRHTKMIYYHKIVRFTSFIIC